jgi:hypothetical protein
MGLESFTTVTFAFSSSDSESDSDDSSDDDDSSFLGGIFCFDFFVTTYQEPYSMERNRVVTVCIHLLLGQVWNALLLLRETTLQRPLLAL